MFISFFSISFGTFHGCFATLDSIFMFFCMSKLWGLFFYDFYFSFIGVARFQTKKRRDLLESGDLIGIKKEG